MAPARVQRAGAVDESGEAAPDAVVAAVAITVWPWMVTPLTVRVLAGFVAANAMTLCPGYVDPEPGDVLCRPAGSVQSRRVPM